MDRKPQTIHCDVPLELAWVHSASQEAVDFVLSQPVGTGDGRSEWVWLRLYNGDLILGVFPQGATYEEMEIEAEFPRV